MALKRKSDGIDFQNEKIKQSYEKLKDADKILFKHLTRALNDLAENAFCGIQIPKKQIPKEYKHFDNLWKYNLPDAWRLIYSIKAPTQVSIISVVLEWMNHKNYEKRFKY